MTKKVIKKSDLKISRLKIKKLNRAFVLSWKKVPDAQNYQVMYRRKGDRKYRKLKTVVSAYAKTGRLKKGAYYYFRVRAAYSSDGSIYKGSWKKSGKLKL